MNLFDNEVISVGSSWERRWQSLAVWTASFEFLALFGVLVWFWALVICCVIPPLFLLLFAYILWALFRDDSAYYPRRSRKLALANWWRSYADYFPLTLVKTADLDPDSKYVFGYHPHGVISIGVVGGFMTDGARTLDLSKGNFAEKEASTERRGFSSLFPGIEPRVVTLAMNFVMPFVREYFLFMGAMAADRKAFKSVLSQGSGSAICVVVGGAEEAQETRQGEITLILEKRKGFVREAMLYGAKLVPVLAFGENDLYNVTALSEGSWSRYIQDLVRKTLSFSTPVFVGRSMFLKAFGLMPMRKPVWIVIGPAIECEHLPSFNSKNPEHSKKLEEAHVRYLEAIGQLYKEYKDHPLQPYRSPLEAPAEGGRLTRKESNIGQDGAPSGGFKIAA